MVFEEEIIATHICFSCFHQNNMTLFVFFVFLQTLITAVAILEEKEEEVIHKIETNKKK